MLHLGLDAVGWDPVHFPNGRREPAEVVLLTYVLNVIENPAERRETLLRAWDLAKSVLVVSARLRWERNQIKGAEYGDGILTQRCTFQRLYAAGELRDYVEEATGVRCVSAAPGIVYAFKDDAARLSYLARQVAPDGVAGVRGHRLGDYLGRRSSRTARQDASAGGNAAAHHQPPWPSAPR
ncbi:DNA phosphorothioation-associated putative methyltransferase [Streptomyces sp. M19]